MQAAQILYLDFDGVLHPAEVRRYRRAPTIRLEAAGHVLFEGCERLEHLLDPYPDVRIVLSTSWVRILGFQRARDYLTPRLIRRVVGATFHTRYHHPDAFTLQPRFLQIMADVCRRNPIAWVAVDDDAESWPDAHRAQLALMPEDRGLLDDVAQEQLRQQLHTHFAI